MNRIDRKLRENIEKSDAYTKIAQNFRDAVDELSEKLYATPSSSTLTERSQDDITTISSPESPFSTQIANEAPQIMPATETSEQESKDFYKNGNDQSPRVSDRDNKIIGNDNKNVTDHEKSIATTQKRTEDSDEL